MEPLLTKKKAPLRKPKPSVRSKKSCIKSAETIMAKPVIALIAQISIGRATIISNFTEQTHIIKQTMFIIESSSKIYKSELYKKVINNSIYGWY